MSKRGSASSPTSPPAVESAQTADVVSKPAPHIIADSIAATAEAREIILANLANAETDGYKRQIVSFTTVLAGPSRADGSRPKQDLLPSSYHVGMAHGSACDGHEPGENPPNRTPARSGDRRRRTLLCDACGQSVEGDNLLHTLRPFTLNEAGGIVLHGLNRDWVLTPPLTIPKRASNVEIMTDGRVRVTVTGKSKDDKPREDQLYVGVITLFFPFLPDCEFTPCGDNVFVAHLKKHQGIGQGMPGQSGYGELRQGCIEESNVVPQQELESLQKLQKQTLALKTQVQLLQPTTGSLGGSTKR